MIKPEWVLSPEQINGQIKYLYEHNPHLPIEVMLKALCESIAKAQAEKIAKWGNETCPHDIFGDGTQCFKHACDMCWASLSGEGE
uniref:Uncharacterized protein n=1 Tax=viral metagenome TaxID=1070528 RepID=A0A6M3JGZ2_9ZZZZ